MSTPMANPARVSSSPAVSDVSAEIPPLPSVPDLSNRVAEPTPAELPIEEVRAEAYRLYVDRGGEDGHDIEDWLAAEALVRARLS